MRSRFGHATRIQHDYLVGIGDRIQPMRNDDRRLLAAELRHRLLDGAFVACIQIGRRLNEYDFDEMLRAFDDAMPENEQLGEYLDAVDVPVADIELGDEVWMETVNSRGAIPVICFE